MDNQVRVTHVMAFDEIPGQAPFSGAENHLFQLVEAQADAGLDVELVMLIGRDGPAIQGRTETLRNVGVRVVPVHIAMPPLRLLRLAVRVAVIPRLVALFWRRRDRVLHTHLAFASLAGRTAARLAGVSAVVDSAHCDEPVWTRRYWRVLLKVLERRTIVQVAISQAVCDHLTDKVGLSADGIRVVRYGVPPGVILEKSEARRRLGLQADAMVVGFVGRLAPQKNVPLLLQAAAAMPDVVFAVIGGGPLEEKLRHAAKNLPHVRFFGFRPDGPELMSAFDAFCLPSDWEGLGLVLIEAMHRRVPIVAVAAGAIPEVLGQGEYGVLVPPGDAPSLVAALRQVLEGHGEAREMTTKAAAWVKSAFTVERMVEQTTEVYLAAIRGRS